jgi:hypothetical protein
MRLIAIAVLWLTAAFVATAAAAPDPNATYTPEQQAWFRSLHPMDRPEPCCDISDCREKASRIAGDDYEVYVDDRLGWVKVPQRAVLHGTPNPIGVAILCYQKARLAPHGLDLIIYCFVPADEG